MEAPAVPLVDLEHCGIIYPGSLSFFFSRSLPRSVFFPSRPLSPEQGECPSSLKASFLGWEWLSESPKSLGAAGGAEEAQLPGDGGKAVGSQSGCHGLPQSLN